MTSDRIPWAVWVVMVFLMMPMGANIWMISHTAENFTVIDERRDPTDSRTPYAITPQIVAETLFFADLIRDRPDDWWDIPVRKAVEYVMRASGGSMNPGAAAERFRELVRSKGLEPLE